MRCPHCNNTFQPPANGKAPQAAKRYKHVWNGKELNYTAAEWASVTGVKRVTFETRLNRGWTMDEALNGRKK